MKIKILLLLSFVFLASLNLFAQKQAVYQCPNKAAGDAVLQNAVQSASAAENSPIDFLTENSPCDYSRSIKATLNRTINGTQLNLAGSHSFSLIKNGENFFSIERFVFKTNRQADSVSRILGKRKDKMLKTQGVTRYDYFTAGNNLIFYIADRRSYQNNLPFFERVKENFLATYK